MAEESVKERFEKKYGERFEGGETGVVVPLKPVPLEPIHVVKKGGMKAVIAGVFLILAGIFGVLSWFGVVLLNMIQMDMTTLIAGAAIFSIFGVIALFAGALAIMKRGWKLALLCSILGMLSFGFFVSTTMCIIGMIILLLAKNEFK